MVNITFEVNDFFLASYIIANSSSKRRLNSKKGIYKEDIIAFLNKAWDISITNYMLIEGNDRGGIFHVIPESEDHSYESLGKRLNTYISQIIETSEYKKLKKQTVDSVQLIKTEWNKNFEQVDKYIRDLGINIKEDQIVWVVHPGLHAGQNLGNNNIIWAYRDDWDNYNTVYLWHEILHSYFEHSKPEHALIECITDYQLKAILNKEKPNMKIGHDELFEIKKKKLPIWQEYLEKGSSDISFLIKEFKKI